MPVTVGNKVDTLQEETRAIRNHLQRELYGLTKSTIATLPLLLASPHHNTHKPGKRVIDFGFSVLPCPEINL